VLIKKVNPSIKSYKNPPRVSPMMPLQKYLNLSTHYDSKEKILEQIDESIERGSATKELKHRSIGIFSNPKDRFSYTGFD
jgi:hypothetical protein